MKLLLDTNVLLRLSDRSHVMHPEALDAVSRLTKNDVECVIVPQVLYEYWAVVTRPIGNNGLGMSTEDADVAASKWSQTFRLLLDERGVFVRWRALVALYDVKGKSTHDARLVAATQRHGLTNILTFNDSDFTRFPMIHAFTPAAVLAGQVLLTSP